jgi:hypothetical protein
MGSFWSFPEIPKGPQSKGALLIIPLMFAVFLVWAVVKLLLVWLGR